MNWVDLLLPRVRFTSTKCSDVCSARKNLLRFPFGAPTGGEVTGEPSDHFTDLFDHFTYLSDHSTGLGKISIHFACLGKYLQSLRRPRRISPTTSLFSANSSFTSPASANISDHFAGLGESLRPLHYSRQTLRPLRPPRQISPITSPASANLSDHFTGLNKLSDHFAGLGKSPITSLASANWPRHILHPLRRPRQTLPTTSPASAN